MVSLGRRYETHFFLFKSFYCVLLTSNATTHLWLLKVKGESQVRRKECWNYRSAARNISILNKYFNFNSSFFLTEVQLYFACAAKLAKKRTKYIFRAFFDELTTNPISKARVRNYFQRDNQKSNDIFKHVKFFPVPKNFYPGSPKGGYL